MITTCLINNYNYARFVGHAVDSVLSQTVPFDEIIVVDDGSTDGSTELLARRYGRNTRIQIIAKNNQGQLSCFNEGYARASGDVVFFLDADDVYESNYLEQAIEVYRRDRHCDFVFCSHRQFGQQNSVHSDFNEDRDLGYSVILASRLREWIGGPTSCLSMRRGVLDKMLPLPFAEDWRTRADDCLVFGASLVGARKYHLAQPLVRYRVHSDNQFCGRAPDKFAVYRRRLAINALFEHLQSKLCYDVQRLADFHHREFCTIAKPTFRRLTQYCRIGLSSRASLLRRLTCMAEMTGYYLRAAIWPADLAHGASHAADSDFPIRLRVFAPEDTAETVDTKPRRDSRRLAA